MARPRPKYTSEAVGQLTGGLVHDFNNLLASISGNLELMRLRTDQGRTAEIGRYIEVAMISVNRATALTHRLLAFSRRQTLDPKPTDVNVLINGMSDLVQRTVGPGIVVETVGAANLWTALVDASQLENALLNLCINARDAMPQGGRITIETANKWMDDHAARQRDPAPPPAPGPLPRAERPRPRPRQAAGGEAPRLRPLLPHQADRRGHGARPVDG